MGNYINYKLIPTEVVMSAFQFILYDANVFKVIS